MCGVDIMSIKKVIGYLYSCHGNISLVGTSSLANLVWIMQGVMLCKNIHVFSCIVILIAPSCTMEAGYRKGSFLPISRLIFLCLQPKCVVCLVIGFYHVVMFGSQEQAMTVACVVLETAKHYPISVS